MSALLVATIYTVVDPWVWAGLALALFAGVLRLRRRLVLLGLVGFFGFRVFQTYVPTAGLHPWPYIMGLVAVILAVAAHAVGLGLSVLLSKVSDKRGDPTA